MKYAVVIWLSLVGSMLFGQNSEINHKLGETYGGGIVVYVTPDGQHGIVCETKDLYSSITMNELTFTESRGVQFKNGDVHDFSDPKYHSELGQNYLDWRLPSFFELQAMLSERDAFPNGLKGNYGFLSLPVMGYTNAGSYLVQLLVYDGKSGKVNWAQYSSSFSLRLVRSF